jgi:SNF2 family DNA or RNA helicase
MTTPVEEALKHITLPFDLHQYQVEDINNGAVANSYGLYEQPGLGKTSISTCISVYKLVNGFNSVVAIVPASLITQWSEWLNSLGLTVTTYRGTPGTRKKMSLDADFILMSPQIYQRDYERLKDLKDIYYLVDEAVNLCNTQNLLYKMLRGGVKKEKTTIKLESGFEMPVIKTIQYPRLADSMLLLTGTPINKPTDAYGLIAITSPGIYANFNQFKRRHVAVEDEWGNPEVYKDLDKMHEALVDNAVIREVTDYIDLPEIVYKIVKYDLTPSHYKIYKNLIDEKIFELEDGTVIDATHATKLYHMAQKFIFSPLEYKGVIEGLEVLDAIIAETDRRIIFANYRNTNAIIMDRYDAGGCYGDIASAKQGEYVKAFKEGSLKTLTANPKSGGVGLNLQIANQIAMPELPITPRDFQQAVARSWRMGQKHRVIVTILVANKTIQATLLKRVLESSDISTKVLHTKKSMREDLFGRGD